MKKLILLLALFASVLFTEKTIAQVTFRVNIGSQPMWGPTGYDYVEYYYLPDIEVYYNVTSQRYVYLENGQWVSRSYLPQRYHDYDVYHSRKVVINEQRPYMHHNDNKARYANWQDQSGRESIRDSREPKYYQNRHHPRHYQYNQYKRTEEYNKKNNHNNRGNKPNNGNGNNRDNGNGNNRNNGNDKH